MTNKMYFKSSMGCVGIEFIGFHSRAWNIFSNLLRKSIYVIYNPLSWGWASFCHFVRKQVRSFSPF